MSLIVRMWPHKVEFRHQILFFFVCLFIKLESAFPLWRIKQSSPENHPAMKLLFYFFEIQTALSRFQIRAPISDAQRINFVPCQRAIYTCVCVYIDWGEGVKICWIEIWEWKGCWCVTDMFWAKHVSYGRTPQRWNSCVKTFLAPSFHTISSSFLYTLSLCASM